MHRAAEYKQQKIHLKLNLYYFILQRSLCVAVLRHRLSEGHIFFKETGALSPVAVTVTGERYACILCNHVIPALQERGYMDRIFLMHNSIPPHIANLVKQLLKRHFGNAKIISHHFP